MKKCTALFLSFLLTAGIASVVCAAEGGTDVTSAGHSYRLVTSDCTWQQAYENARAAGGSLVTFESADEFNALISQIEQAGLSDIMFRIGGRRNPAETQYYWVDKDNRLTGSVLNDPSCWAYSFWMQGEPSFEDGSIQEAYMDMYYYQPEGRWVLNDVPDDIISIVPGYSTKLGYVIEFGDSQTAAGSSQTAAAASSQAAASASSQAAASATWQSAYREFIFNQSYLNTPDTYWGYDPDDDGTASYDAVSFALRDMNADGVPELIIYNGNEIYAGSANQLYRYSGGQVEYVDVLPASSYNQYFCLDELALPGIFINGAHTGAYWTEYYSFNGTELQTERVWEGSDFTGDPDTGENVFETDPDTGDPIPSETYRTENETLYKGYQLIESSEGGTELSFSTLSEINASGWAGFLSNYGYTEGAAAGAAAGTDAAAGAATGTDAATGAATGTDAATGAAAGTDAATGAAAGTDAAAGSTTGTDAAADVTTLLQSVPDNFYFSSGVGGWGSEITLNDDGTFTGNYHDSNMGENTENYPGGTVYLCNFSGSFTDFQKVDDYTWTMRLASLNYENNVEDDWTDGEVHYIASEAYGISGGDLFYLYLPGHPVDALPEEYMSWARMYMGYEEPPALTIYGIYNEAQQLGWCGSTN